MGQKSTVAKANTKSSSVRTTIPEKIVQEMDIAIGDVLDWETTTQGGRKVVRVKKLE
jgi:bifunctional DNA-binding transcriptional regulator/antitoxin component of YhaV-PrlF toxin-antitoxin module